MKRSTSVQGYLISLGKTPTINCSDSHGYLPILSHKSNYSSYNTLAYYYTPKKWDTNTLLYYTNTYLYFRKGEELKSESTWFFADLGFILPWSYLLSIFCS